MYLECIYILYCLIKCLYIVHNSLYVYEYYNTRNIVVYVYEYYNIYNTIITDN